MKKVFASVAFVAMMVCAAACGNNQESAEGEAAVETVEVVEEVAPAADSCACACDSCAVAE